MKKLFCVLIAALVLGTMLQGCGSKNETPEEPQEEETRITAELAYEGVNNYCHEKFDWGPAEENPDIMYVEMGEESDTEYQVIFRSYTGAFDYFYVNKEDGSTRIVTYVPSLDLTEENGTINLFDYLEKN
ncbi:MAG: hypothetical protein II045_02960 [Oscillospiraceae bacterium]|nr:hypothetical protein [Oscillospiraceae bacterium]